MTAGAIPRGTGRFVERAFQPEPERQLEQDPVKWTVDRLGEHPWSVQRKIMRSVVENRRTAVPSAHGTGKSYTASRLAGWWIDSHPIGEAFVVSSAPTKRQVDSILWREIRRAHRRAHLPGRITLESVWYVGPRGAEEEVAYGRKPADLRDTDQAMQAFQGIHARYVLVILDEATGIPEWLWNAADSLLTNEHARILAIGNPDDPTSRFERECAPGSGANVIPVSVFDTPVYTGERVPSALLELLTGKTWVEERRTQWGEDSPLWLSKVLGQFPDEGADLRVITPGMISAATLRELDGTGLGAYGMDVARFGTSESAIYRSRDGVIRLESAWRKAPTTVTTGKAKVVLDKHAKIGVPMAVDVPGVGGGPYDSLKEDGYNVLSYNGGEKAIDSKRFANRRSESWWNMREDCEAGLIDLDGADELLLAQLQAPQWTLTSKGQIRVETKDEMLKRGVPSPDRADAAIMAREAERAGKSYTNGYRSKRRKTKSETADLLRRPM